MLPLPHRAASVLATLLAAICILLIALFLRTHNALMYPPFIDEAHHIQWASDVYDLRPFTGAANGKLFGLWWMSAFGLYDDAALWIARVATALFSLVGIAALYGLSAALASPRVGLLAAFAYAVSPFAFFFEGMALLDSYVVVFALLTAWFAVRYTQQGRRTDAIMIGLALAGAVFAKATGVMLAPVPALAILLLTRGWAWRQRMAGLLWSYGIFALIWGPFYLFLRWRGYNYFSTATTVVGTSDTDDVVGRLFDNFSNVLRVDETYLGTAFLLLVLAGSVFLVIHKPRVGLFLLLTALAPLAGLMAFATRLSTRYIHFHVPFLILLLALGISLLAAKLFARMPRKKLLAPVVIVLLWTVVQAGPFMITYWNNPLDLDLPHMDFIEYVAGDSAGFGLPEIAAILRQDAEQTDRAVQLVGLISNCEGLLRILPQASRVTVICPYVTLDGSEQANVAAQVNALVQQAGTAFNLWIALEDQSPYFSLEGITGRLEPVQVVERPGGLTQMSLYRVSP